jgi:hypothetical protein
MVAPLLRATIGDGKEFTDRLFGLLKRAATGAHAFDQLCATLDIEHRLREGLIQTANTGRRVWADTAYRSVENEA